MTGVTRGAFRRKGYVRYPPLDLSAETKLVRRWSKVDAPAGLIWRDRAWRCRRISRRVIRPKTAVMLPAHLSSGVDRRE